jgi:hypothetical protein
LARRISLNRILFAAKSVIAIGCGNSRRSAIVPEEQHESCHISYQQFAQQEKIRPCVSSDSQPRTQPPLANTDSVGNRACCPRRSWSEILIQLTVCSLELAMTSH